MVEFLNLFLRDENMYVSTALTILHSMIYKYLYYLEIYKYTYTYDMYTMRAIVHVMPAQIWTL
jgi:hypothetical protein